MDFLMELAVAAGIAALLRGLVFMLVKVEGASMRDTLGTGDRLLATRLDALLRAPERGRVVLCRYPGSRKCYVKRLIGCPGDVIEVRAGRTYINGVEQREEYVTHPTRRDFGPVVLKANEYFVMGDNRANSRDSRAVGPLGRRQIIAVVRLRLWPRGRMGRIPVYPPDE